VWCDSDGLAVFDKLHNRAHDGEVIPYALTWTARTGGSGPLRSARIGSPNSSPTPRRMIGADVRPEYLTAGLRSAARAVRFPNYSERTRLFAVNRRRLAQPRRRPSPIL
jgi:hypothetical protein